MTTESLVSSKSKHFSLYSLYFCSRDSIFDVLKAAYISVAKDNLPIFGIAKANKLVEYATTESDVSRGISRMPLVLARIYEEDIKFETKTPKNAPSGNQKQFKQSPSAMQREQLSESDRFI